MALASGQTRTLTSRLAVPRYDSAAPQQARQWLLQSLHVSKTAREVHHIIFLRLKKLKRYHTCAEAVVTTMRMVRRENHCTRVLVLSLVFRCSSSRSRWYCISPVDPSNANPQAFEAPATKKSKQGTKFANAVVRRRTSRGFRCSFFANASCVLRICTCCKLKHDAPLLMACEAR